MIPGESNGTESTARPLSSVVCRIGNGNTFSASGGDGGAAPRPKTTAISVKAHRVRIVQFTPGSPFSSTCFKRSSGAISAHAHGEPCSIRRHRDPDELAAGRVAVGDQGRVSVVGVAGGRVLVQL